MNRIVTYDQQIGAALRSRVAWMVLGLVIERPSYGYELLQRYRRAYGEMLPLTGVNQVYDALDALKRRSLIEQTRDVPASTPVRRPKPHYRATELGLRAYEEWLLMQLDEERQRSRQFARQLAMLEPGAALEVLDEYERAWLTEADDASPAETTREALAERLVEGEEQTALEVRIAWIEFARNELKALIAAQPKGASES